MDCFNESGEFIDEGFDFSDYTIRVGRAKGGGRKDAVKISVIKSVPIDKNILEDDDDYFMGTGSSVVIFAIETRYIFKRTGYTIKLFVVENVKSTLP